MKVVSMNPWTLEQVAALEAEYTPRPWSRRMIAEELDLLAMGLVLVDESKQVQGYLLARLLGDTWQLFNLLVTPAHRRQGWAQQLLEPLITQSQEDGYPILLEVRRSNLGAQQLYERLGFRLLTVRKGYYPGPGPEEDALVMIRDNQKTE